MKALKHKSRAIILITVLSLVFSPLSLTGGVGAPSLAVNEARAISLSFGANVDPWNLAQMLLEWAAKTLLERAKQKALREVNKLQLDFLRGPARGLEKVVTNWPRELQQAFNLGLDSFMDEIDATSFCDGIQLPAKQGIIALRSPRPYSARFACTFDNAFGSFNSFVTETENYPNYMLRYAAYLRPENDPLNAQIEAVHLGLSVGSEEKETALAKIEAGGGVKPTQDCDVPKPGPGGVITPLNDADYDLGEDYWKSLCAVIRDTTPGKISADQTINNLDSSNKYTVNMQAVAGNIASLLGSFIANTLIDKIFTQPTPEHGLLGPQLNTTANTDPCFNITPNTVDYATCKALNGDGTAAKQVATTLLDKAISAYAQAKSLLEQYLDCKRQVCVALNPSSPQYCYQDSAPPMSTIIENIAEVNDTINRLTFTKLQLAGISCTPASCDAQKILNILNNAQTYITDAESVRAQANRDLTSCQNELASLGNNG